MEVCALLSAILVYICEQAIEEVSMMFQFGEGSVKDNVQQCDQMERNGENVSTSHILSLPLRA